MKPSVADVSSISTKKRPLDKEEFKHENSSKSLEGVSKRKRIHSEDSDEDYEDD